MKLSWFGRLALALFASLALGLGMSACGGGTIAYMWVLGQASGGGPDGQIAAFKVDDYTGNLTQAPHQPFASQGANPVMIVVKAGGRFVYVLNQGSSDTTTSNSNDAGVALFTVGGDGSLSYLQTYTSQGFTPQYMQFDSTNSYLYVLDKYSPDYKTTGNGSITVFSVDPTTGRLTLVLNNQSPIPNQPSPTYWDVGQDPFMMKSAGSCLFTVNSADHSITPYSQGGSGQLVNVTTGKVFTNASDITSINGNGSYIILTDAGSNTVFPYQISGSCGLSTFVGGPQYLGASTSNPVYSFIDTSGKYLYILNQSSTNTTPTQSASSITGYFINTSSGLSPLTGSPYSVDSGPVCMVEDPTNKYLYISDHNSGQVTGKIFDPNTGALQQLTRGSTFSATGLATCMAISGAVD
jgi:6-phosphogluconolactonase (cycloisomerase 2 family)